MAADIRFRVARFVVDGSKGVDDTQEFTVAGLGWTPKAAVFLTGPFDTEGANAAAGIGFGATAFSEDWGIQANSSDNANPTEAGAGGWHLAALVSNTTTGADTLWVATTAGDGAGNNPGPIPNGFRVKYMTAPSADYVFYALLIGGADVEAAAVSAIGSVGGSESIGFGFQPDLILGGSNYRNDKSGIGGHSRLCIGYARKPGAAVEQGCITYVDEEGLAGDSNSHTLTDDGMIANLLGPADGSSLRQVTIDDITATNCDITWGGDWTSPYTQRTRFLALKFNGGKSWAGIVDSPTSPGNDWVENAPGFRPGALIFGLGNPAAVDTPRDGLAWGIGFAAGGAGACVTLTSEDATGGASNASTWLDPNRPIYLRDHDHSVLHDIAQILPTDTGWWAPASEITTADATARKWIAFAIEGIASALHEGAAAASGSATASAGATALRPAAATVGAGASATGTVAAICAAFAGIGGQATGAAVIAVHRAAAGIGTGVASCAADAQSTRAAAATAGGAAVATGTTEAADTHAVAGSAQGVATTAGAATPVRYANAAVSGLGVPQGIPFAVRGAAAEVAGLGTAAGTPTTVRGAQGSVAGAASATGAIGGDWLAIGTAAGMAVVVGLAIGGYGASKAEKILRALKARLETVDGVRVERNAALPERIPGGGLIVLRDGDPGEPDVALGGFAGAYYSHSIEVEVYVAEGDDAARDTAFDSLLQALEDALIADQTLGGLVFGMEYGRPAVDVEPVEGAAAIKSATLPIVVDYETATRLG